MVYTCGLFHRHCEKGIMTSSGTLLKETTLRTCASTILWKSIKHIVTNSVTHHMDNSKGQEKVSTSHLQIGELLLLMGDGLLHQDTLNALFHCIFLCLGSKNRVWIANGSTTSLACFVWTTSSPTRCNASCCSGVRGGRPSLEPVLCPFSIVRASPPWNSQHQFNTHVKSKSENGALSKRTSLHDMIVPPHPKKQNPSVETHQTKDQYAAIYCM